MLALLHNDLLVGVDVHDDLLLDVNVVDVLYWKLAALDAALL